MPSSWSDAEMDFGYVSHGRLRVLMITNHFMPSGFAPGNAWFVLDPRLYWMMLHLFSFPRLYWMMLDLFMQPRLYWMCPFYGLVDKKTKVCVCHALPSGNIIWCPNSTDSLCSKLATPRLMGTLASQKMLPKSYSGPTWWFTCTQTHHNNKQVIAVEFTCATGKSSTCSTHYHTQGCEVSPYEDAINGPSSPTFLCTSCLPFLFHPFRGLRLCSLKRCTRLLI